MSLVSNTGTLTIASSMPSWVPGTLLTWATIPNSAHSSVDPSPTPPGNSGPASKEDAWTSFAIDPRDSSVYSPGNGGHNDYAGNEVDRLVLETNSPGWTQVRGPTPNAQIVYAAQYYSDGRPTAAHTWPWVTFDAFTGSGRIMRMGGTCYGSGNELAAMDSFNLASNDWSPQGTHPIFPLAAYANGTTIVAMAHDERNANVYSFGNNVVYRWRRVQNDWFNMSPSGAPAQYGHRSAAAWDSTRNRFFILGGISGPWCHTYDPDLNALTQQSLSGAGASAVSGLDEGGLVYVPALDIFVARNGSASGGTVYQINASTFVVTAMTTTGGGSIPAAANSQIFKRFLYAPRLKSIIFVPVHSSSAWVLRLHN